MNLPLALLSALIITAVASAQDQPPPATPAQPAAPEAAPSAAPGETVKAAMPADSLPASTPASFSQDDIRKVETALKKEMMLVGMACGVAGLLLGMMIGRKTAPRPMGRRF